MKEINFDNAEEFRDWFWINFYNWSFSNFLKSSGKYSKYADNYKKMPSDDLKIALGEFALELMAKQNDGEELDEFLDTYNDLKNNKIIKI